LQNYNGHPAARDGRSKAVNPRFDSTKMGPGTFPPARVPRAGPHYVKRYGAFARQGLNHAPPQLRPVVLPPRRSPRCWHFVAPSTRSRYQLLAGAGLARGALRDAL